MFSRRLLLLRSCERGWSPCLCKGGRSRKTRQRSPDHPKSSRRSRKSPLRPALSGKMSWLSGGSAAREPWSVVRGESPRWIVSPRRSGPVGRAPGWEEGIHPCRLRFAQPSHRCDHPVRGRRCRVVGSVRCPVEGNLQGRMPTFRLPTRPAAADPTRHPRRRGGPTQPCLDEHPTPARALCFLTKPHPGQTTTGLAVRSDKVMSAPPICADDAWIASARSVVQRGVIG